MNLYEMFNGVPKKKLFEGGNLGSHKDDGTPMPGWKGIPGQHQAQSIDLKVHKRSYITPILSKLLYSINDQYAASVGGPLWNPKALDTRKYLSGSSLHFFDTNIPDDEFERVKPKVGDIDTQINKAAEPQVEQWLDSVQGKVIGNGKLIGYSRGNEQFSSMWELTDPPIKVQIDLEFVDYTEKDEPTDWASFSHSSSWEDLSQGIKGVFHKYIIQAFTKLTTKEFLLRKLVGRGKARIEQDVPTTDNMFSFAVSSKEGGGLRPKYEPVVDEKGKPLIIDGLPVMRALPTSGYEKDLGVIFQSIFGERISSKALQKVMPKTWSFVGLLELMNMILSPEEKDMVFGAFVDKLFAPGAQGLYKGDPKRDLQEKNAALNYALKVLQINPPQNLEQMRQDYVQNYKVTSEGPIGLDRPVVEAEEKPAVKAQLRKGMPHLRDLKPADFLDLVDELRSEGGRFKLQNIPLNVKIDGFGGRFGKNADGKPFMGTSRTEPRYSAGFLKYHQEKGTDDPEILARAEKFDQLFDQMMAAISAIDSKMGNDFLVDKQVTCEVLFLPFATQTEEGKLKFVGIEYDQLPKGVDLVLVPYKIVQASTGEDIPNGDQITQEIAELGRNGNVMFLSNRLVQKDGLDVTEIINPLDNLEELKQIVSDTAGKRDRASIELRREVETKLKPVQIALEKAIDEDPNIVGKDNLGQEYEGIVINSRLGPIKVTSQKQKDIIAQKNAARAAARAEQPRENQNKTAVVAVGSFVGHVGHEQLWNLTQSKADELSGDPYLFIGTAEGKDDPIPPSVKVQTWQKLYPEYAKNISTVTQEGGSLLQKIKHELINPLPGKPPRYDNIVIAVGKDRESMASQMSAALMKAVNKFQGYEHVKVTPYVTPRAAEAGGTGVSFTGLRNVLKDQTTSPETQYQTWAKAFDEKKLGKDWILHLMDITRKGMGIQEPKQPTQQPTPTGVPMSEMRLFNALVLPLNESTRMSAAVKLQRAMDRQRSKSDASRRRGEEVMAQARSDWEKKQAAEKNKEINELSRDTLKQYFPKRVASAKQLARTDYEKAKRITRQDLPRAMSKLKDPQYGKETANTENEGMLPKNAFSGSDKNKLGPAGQAKKQKAPLTNKLVGEQGVAEAQLDEINWKKAAATGALALGALGGLGASGSAQARVTPGADGQMSPSAAQQMSQQGFQASAEKPGGQMPNQNLDSAEKVERGDNGIIVHYGGKEYKGMLVPKDGPTPRGAKMIKINQGQMGERGIGNYTTYLLPNGTAYIYKLASQSANEGVAEAFGPLPKDNQQIRLGRHTVDIERVGLNKNYIGFTWNDSQGQEHYEEVAVGDLGSYDDLIKKIKQEISYQERKYTDQGVAEEKVKGVDGKACWKGKRYAGKVKKADGTYKDKCVPIGEAWEIEIAKAVIKLVEGKK